ncbi:MAG: dihydroorotate dehydrogenase [Verrucomicrobiales bacterium]|jgi:dihydroorotate dehydrogenase
MTSHLRNAVNTAVTCLYEPLARPLLFGLDPESAHHVTLAGLQFAHRTGLDRLLASSVESDPVEVMGLQFPNRLGLAAGLDKEGTCVDAFGAMGFGFVEVGTITPKPQPGNPRPRLFRIPEAEAIINRMGFNNPGIDQGVANVRHRSFDGVLGFNIGKNKDTPNERAIEDYLIGLRAAYPVADYVAVNLSSPNTAGLRDLQEEAACRALLKRLKEEQAVLGAKHCNYVPIVIKIAPDLSADHIKMLAGLFLESKIDGVIATNTTVARTFVEDHVHAGEAGGLSGAPVTDASTDVIRILAKSLHGKIPIIGVGGIMNGRDALDKLSAGADLVQIYSGLVYRGPGLIGDVLQAIAGSGK